MIWERNKCSIQGILNWNEEWLSSPKFLVTANLILASKSLFLLLSQAHSLKKAETREKVWSLLFLSYPISYLLLKLPEEIGFNLLSNKSSVTSFEKKGREKVNVSCKEGRILPSIQGWKRDQVHLSPVVLVPLLPSYKATVIPDTPILTVQ